MRRAVVPLVRAGCSLIEEFVVDWLPGLTGIIGALHDLSVPATRLGSIDPIGVHGRPLHMINFPTAEKWPRDIPLLTLAIGSEDERAFLGAYQHAHSAHLGPSQLIIQPI